MPPANRSERILVIRLDRLGDVILSLPVLQVLRAAYPHAFLAMLIRAEWRAVVDGHPAIDEVLVYEKTGAQRGVAATVRFARGLRCHRFDTVLILHPTARSHWIARLAGIPRRIGYDRKSPWLLTQRVPHDKHEGRKHEAEYALELLRPLGIAPPVVPAPVIRLDSATRAAMDQRLRQLGIAAQERVVAIHPSASCLSKRWMPDRFAAVADQLIDAHALRIVIVAAAADAAIAAQMRAAMRHGGRAIDLTGTLSIGELACVLARASLLISNDSGPMHVAAAVGTPVVAIFGRTQPGLSHRRWAPLGPGHVLLHRDPGCETCLAHRCNIGFVCLTSLSIADVTLAASSVLSQSPPPPLSPTAAC